MQQAAKPQKEPWTLDSADFLASLTPEPAKEQKRGKRRYERPLSRAASIGADPEEIVNYAL